MCGIIVCFLVVMLREVIERLEGKACIGMVRYTIFTGAVEVFQCMDGSFIVLVAGIVDIRGKEGESR